MILLSGHANNIHCMAKAVNSLAGAMFTVYGPSDVNERLKEFLAVSRTECSVSNVCSRSDDDDVRFLQLASASLLRLGQERGQDKESREAVKNRESVYLLLDEVRTRHFFMFRFFRIFKYFSGSRSFKSLPS